MKLLIIKFKKKINLLLSSKYREEKNQFHNKQSNIDFGGHWQSDDLGQTKEQELLDACLRKQA